MDTTLDLHLRVVGTLLEEHALYRAPKLHAVKELVLRVLQELGPEPSTVRQIHEVLCYEDIPLVPDKTVREALNSLARTDQKVEILATQPKSYRLLVALPPKSSSLPSLVDRAWDRHFATCGTTSKADFERCIALLFARYGCAAFETLVSRGSKVARLPELLATAIPADGRLEFSECFSAFVSSPHSDDALLKLKLASTYALLRMNGAGNSRGGELAAFFNGKTFLLDTNVLFEILAGNGTGQIAKVFVKLGTLGARFVVGAETQKEFETALRSKADQVLRILERRVDLARLLQQHVTRADWIAELLKDSAAPSRDQMLERTEAVLADVGSVLSAASIPTVFLDRGTAPEERLRRIERVKELALEVRHFAKGDDVALHDSLLWEAVEETPPLADLILTRDRSLAHLRAADRRASVMLDEVVAYALVGGAGENELAALFSHTLSRDLYPDAEFLSLSDIESIAGMESTLLLGPPRALKKAAVDLFRLRVARAATGEPVRDDEVGRILVDAISGYREDRVLAALARADADAEKERAEKEHAEKIVAMSEADALRAKLSAEEEARRAHRTAAEHESARLAVELAAERAAAASLRAEATVAAQREAAREAHDTSSRLATARRRDWMLWCACVAAVAFGFGAFGLFWAAGVAAVVVVAAMFWIALAQETPPVSFAIVSGVVAVLAGVATFAEKWPALARLLEGTP